MIIVIIVAALIGLLIGADRAAAAYAENRVANQIKSYGFPEKPSVTIEGFPFLTQVVSRHIDAVDISSDDFRAGPVRASVHARASGISLNSGYQSGTIDTVTASGLISFARLASMADAAGAPGLKISRAGRHAVKLTANLEVVSATATAKVIKVGQDKFKIHVVSAGGIPLSLLGPIRNFTVPIPALPLGLSVRSVIVTGKGVAVQIDGHNVHFG